MVKTPILKLVKCVTNNKVPSLKNFTANVATKVKSKIIKYLQEHQLE